MNNNYIGVGILVGAAAAFSIFIWNSNKVSNEYYNKKKRQACLSVFLFLVFSKRNLKDTKANL
jgi:hypothetical protein